MNAHTSYKVSVCIEPREDGGIRVWSEDLPELVLSHADRAAVFADIIPALTAILGERFGSPVEIEALEALPTEADANPPNSGSEPTSRFFAARAA